MIKEGKQKSGNTYIPQNNETGNEKQEVSLDLHIPLSDKTEGFFLFLDIETTGLPKWEKAKPEDLDNWPRIVQIAWILCDEDKKMITSDEFLIKQEKPIPSRATEIHGITTEVANENGIEMVKALELLSPLIKNTFYVIAHNIAFDIPIIESEFLRAGFKKHFVQRKKICTMKEGTEFCQLYKYNGRGYKYPKLTELAKELFFPNARSLNYDKEHSAGADVLVTAKCFFEMLDRQIIILK